jgi:uncharacterized protein (TIGR02265 family)
MSGRVKGSVLLSRLAFVRERMGAVSYKALLAGLSEDDQRVLGEIVLSSAWYPFALNERLDAAIAAKTGRGDAVFRELGARSANDNLGASQRNFVRERDPHGLLKHATSIYRLYYDTGNRTYERVGDHKAILRTHDSESFSRADCLTVVGWHEKAIQLCGGRNPRVVEKQCRARGAPFCEYVCEWE